MMGCEYCTWKERGGKPEPICPSFDKYWPVLFINDSNLQMDRLKGVIGRKKVSRTTSISFCPMCGRKLGDTND